ncbi:hypothetical protein L1987_53470 [Smallanthus sonchifolius]|uniref:Uncharacterized protein n=1 Tax=Smallanthus sonchifolius TaxID=185202 RepID=A0ACB9EWS4_9ASTR|nr:hypothetical protein L1987_53470 [Smallanthus sonchifolius]
MSTRLHFFILVLVLLTTLTFNGASPQTQKLEKGHRVSANGATYGMKKRSGSSTRVLEENPGSRQTNPDDLASKPRVMGHGQFKSLRSQPSGAGEEDDIDGREVILSQKIKLKPKRGNNPNRGISPVPAPKV